MMSNMDPTIFPSDSSPFIKIIESSLNLQIIFHLTVFNNLTFDALGEKMKNPDKKAIQDALNTMMKMGLIEGYQKSGETHYKFPSLRYTPKEYDDIKE